MLFGILACLIFGAFVIAVLSWMDPGRYRQLDNSVLFDKPKDRLLLSTPTHDFKLYMKEHAYGVSSTGRIEAQKGSIVTVDGFLGYLWMECGFAILYELSEAYKLVQGAKQSLAVGTTHYMTVDGVKTRHCVVKAEGNKVYLVPMHDLGTHFYLYSVKDKVSFAEDEVCYDNVKIRDIDKCVEEHLQLTK